MVMPQKKRKKPNPRPKIEYPPVPTKKWVPPDQRPRRKPKPTYVKPPGISHPLKISSLGKMWHGFKVMGDRTFILGNFSETHKRFTYKSNGHQTSCNCTIAVAFSKLYDISRWSSSTVDKVLEFGDQHYLTSLSHLEDRRKTCVELADVYPTFFFEESKITMSIKGGAYKGKIFANHDDTPCLADVLKDFFNDKHESGVISTQGRCFALWLAGTSYFLFDPTEHDELAYPWKGVPGRGFAFVMRFQDTDALVGVLQENCDQNLMPKFTLTPCSIIRVVKLNTTPPDNVIVPHCGDTTTQPTPEHHVPAKPPPKPPKDDEDPDDHELLLELHDLDDQDMLNESAEVEEYAPEAADVTHKEVPASMIPVERAKAESITYFASVVQDKVGILRASTFQGDTRFSKYRGRQSLANAMAALTMLRFHKSRTWIRKTLDEVLLLGETIHEDSLSGLGPDQVLKITTLTKKISLNERDFAPEIDEFSTVGRLQSPQSDVVDLLPAFQEFFRDHDACVVAGPLSLAVWKEDGLYYMFDPNERDPSGLAIVKSLQVGSELKVLEYTPGVACVTWFKTLKDLAAVYMNNVDRPYRRDPFLLCRVQINDAVTIPSPWHNFQGLAQGKWILRGTFSQRDRRFDKETRNTQCTPAAAVALAFSRMKHVKQWTTEDVDEVLIQGDELYKNCVESLKEAGRFVDPKLMISEVLRKFPLEQYEVGLDVQDCLVNGLLDAKDENDAFNLKRGMEEFFRDNETGVLTTRSISVALWKNDEIYYYYDSHSADDQGVTNNFGTACVLRLLDLADLAKTIEANLSPGPNNDYNISLVGIKLWEQNDEGVVRPPLNNFTEVDQNYAILRSLFSERSPDFHLNRGRQTVPMCLVAAGMTKIYAPGLWSRDVIDEVLHLGDKLYVDTMVAREKAPDLAEQDDVDEVYAENCLMYYHIGLNKFSLTYGEVYEGNFENNFVDAMVAFFNEMGQDGKEPKELLVTSDVYTVLTWTSEGVFYLFDPKPRDEAGQVFGKEEWTLKLLSSGEEEGSDFYDIFNGVAEIGAGDQGAHEVVEDMRRSIASQVAEDVDEAAFKHDSKYWRAHEDAGGKACAMWFTTLEKLVQHILENTPPTRREDINFKLFPVMVTTVPEIKHVYDPEHGGEREDPYAGDWYEFKEIDHGRWILRGTMDFHHLMFPAHNRGRQSVATCYTALAYAFRFAISKFKSITVDDILKYGDRLHSATRRLRLKALRRNRELQLSDQEVEDLLNRQSYGIDQIQRAFCIGPDQILAELTPNVTVGDIHADNHEDVLDVKRGLSTYFEEYSAGLLVAKNLTVAVWRGVKVYYMFDPNPRGPSGVRETNGDACITRYLELEVMADVFLKNLAREGSNSFAIHMVGMRLQMCPRPPKPEEIERPDVRPKLHGYDMLVPGKAILHGTLNQDDPKFGRGKNVQCAPIAIVALTMTLIHKASNWTKPIIDEILILGDELYVATLDTLGFEYNPWEQGMNVHLVNKDYKMGTVRANCELRTMDQRGIIDIKHPKVLNLRQGIERFFEENTHGVIETETLTVAIWEEEDQNDLIYMFDPNPRGPAGLPFVGGTACVVTFESAKMAADHFISNIADKSRRTGEFVVTPVEIVVGNVRTKRKPKKDPSCCKECDTNVAKPSPTESEKKRLRKMAEDDRARKEALRLSKLGRGGFYSLPNGDAILRGTKSQSWKGYSLTSQGNQDIPNCCVAFVLHRLIFVSEWNYRQIDLVLDIGDQLYKDSYITYSPQNPKLGFKNILRRIFIKDVQMSLAIYKPVMSNTLTAFNLEVALVNYFHQEQFGILSANDQHVGLFFKEGFYYVFDPHDRDVEGNRCVCGCACVMKFPTLQSLVNKFMDNVLTMFDSVKDFTITLVTLSSITKKGTPPEKENKVDFQ